MMMSIADWMQTTWIFDLLVEYNEWIWPFLESLHFIGMCLLFGALLVMDLRLMGWEKGSAIVDTDKLAPIVLAGFGINLITGVLFVFGDPHRYFVSIAFYFKMSLIILAALNLVYYKLRIAPLLFNVGSGEDPPTIARISGTLSLVLWLGVICFGRLIPYLGDI
jgi:hypothetical protein